MLFVIIKMFGGNSMKNLVIFFSQKDLLMPKNDRKLFFTFLKGNKDSAEFVRAVRNTIIFQKVTSDDGY